MEQEMCRIDCQDYIYIFKHYSLCYIFRINNAKLNLSVKLSEGPLDVRTLSIVRVYVRPLGWLPVKEFTAAMFSHHSRLTSARLNFMFQQRSIKVEII